MTHLQQTFIRARRRLYPVAVILALTALAAAGAVAQSAGKVMGTMEASGDGPPPSGAVIAVRTLSGGPETEAIADSFRDALERAGYQTAGGLDYSLSFLLSGASPDSRRGASLELRGSDGSSSSGDVQLTMRWKATGDKTARPRRGRRLSISISDKDRNLVWQARIDLRASDAGDLAMVNAVMPALIANMGRTVYALRVP